MEDLSKRTVNIKYKKSPDYRISPATGAWGGVTPQAEVLCSFFVEHVDTPESVNITIENGVVKAGDEVSSGNWVRELQTAVIMRPDIAKSVGKWLIKKAEEAMSPKPTLNS